MRKGGREGWIDRWMDWWVLFWTFACFAPVSRRFAAKRGVCLLPFLISFHFHRITGVSIWKYWLMLDRSKMKSRVNILWVLASAVFWVERGFCGVGSLSGLEGLSSVERFCCRSNWTKWTQVGMLCLDKRRDRDCVCVFCVCIYGCVFLCFCCGWSTTR